MAGVRGRRAFLGCGHPDVKDLCVLTADADMLAAMDELLRRRPEALGIHPIDVTIERHTRRDPGCRREAATRLRAYADDHRFALLMFDRHGSGDPAEREHMQTVVQHDLSQSGWQNRSKAIVIDPELEAWMWTTSPHTAGVLGWEGNNELRAWLRDQDLWPAKEAKPPDPKEALHKGATGQQAATQREPVFGTRRQSQPWALRGSCVSRTQSNFTGMVPPERATGRVTAQGWTGERAGAR